MEATADHSLHQTLAHKTYQTEARRLRQEFQTAQSAATRDYNKATVEAAGQRDRTLANARTNLAAAKGTWEQGLVSQTDTNTTVEKPSLDPPTTQPPSESATARQLSTLFSGGLVSVQPEQPQTGGNNNQTAERNLEEIPINETPAPIDPPPTPSIPLNIYTGPLPVAAEPPATTLQSKATTPGNPETGFFDWLTGLYASSDVSESPSSVTSLSPLLGIGGALSVGMEQAAAVQAEMDAAQALEADPDFRQGYLELQEGLAKVEAFAALNEQIENAIGLDQWRELTTSQMQKLRDAGILKAPAPNPYVGPSGVDGPSEVTDSNGWWPGGSHYLIVQNGTQKFLYELSDIIVDADGDAYRYQPFYLLRGIFSALATNNAIIDGQEQEKAATAILVWETFLTFLPGGSSASDLADENNRDWSSASFHFVQDVVATLSVYGKVAQLSRFSKLAGVAGRLEKASRHMKLAMVLSEVGLAGISVFKAGEHINDEEYGQAAGEAFNVLMGVFGIKTNWAEYRKAAAKAMDQMRRGAEKIDRARSKFRAGWERIFGDPRKQHQAEELVDEAARIAGHKSWRDFADEVIYDPSATLPHFHVTPDGIRQIVLNPTTMFEPSLMTRQMRATHEFVHARQFDEWLELTNNKHLTGKLLREEYLRFHGGQRTWEYAIREYMAEFSALTYVMRYYDWTPEMGREFLHGSFKYVFSHMRWHGWTRSDVLRGFWQLWEVL